MTRNHSPVLRGKFGWVIISVFGLLCMLVPVWSQEVQDLPQPEMPTFKLNVIRDQYLPPAMYGTWSITATVLRSDAPTWLHSPGSHEIWSLAKINDEIILKNEANNAVTSIEVDRVEGNTATFHHEAKVPSRKIRIIETPTVTVDGDYLSGINRQNIIVQDRQGKVMQTYHLEIRLEGTRLTGANVVFKDTETIRPKFEVAPMQFEEE
jgi:hypothetical protein